MVRITVEMVRKKTEHHDRLLGPVEEIALHQENIDKIEYLQDWCPNLTILLLQSNLISKIENLNKLKGLTYLNLALNNIEIIENLERLESLQKLDLTLNFIGKISSVESLRENYNLEILFLVGNPCTDFENYRDFVIAMLPQLRELDGTEIERIEKIQAKQKLYIIKPDVLFEEDTYLHERRQQKKRLEVSIKDKWEKLEQLQPEEQNKKFYSEKCEYAPEVRHEMENYRLLKLRREEDARKEKEPPKREIKLFTPNGRPFNINQAKVQFTLNEDDPEEISLDIAVYKYLDSSLIDVDVQPNYVRAILKGKIFQIALNTEIDAVRATAKRSQTTGHLLITLPKPTKQGNVDEEILTAKTAKKSTKKNGSSAQLYSEHRVEECLNSKYQSKREYLEIGPPRNVLDFTNMTQAEKPTSDYADPRLAVATEKIPSKDFIDNPNVPPLI